MTVLHLCEQKFYKVYKTSIQILFAIPIMVLFGITLLCGVLMGTLGVKDSLAQNLAMQEKLPKTLNDYNPKKIVSVITGVQEKWMENYNPFSPSQLPTVKDFMFESMVIYEKQTQAKPHFRLAENYEYNQNNLQIKFTLKKDLKWSDGAPLTADDVVFTFETLKEYPEMDHEQLWGYLLLDAIKLNNETILFNLKTPNNTAHINIGQTPILPKHIWNGLPRLNLYRNVQKIGSGLFTEIVDSQVNRYHQCINPYHWEKESTAIDCIKVHKFTSETLAKEAIKNDDVDWLTMGYDDIEKNFISKNPEYNDYVAYDLDTTGIMLNYKTKHPGNKLAFSTMEFKKAMAMAIDRTSITRIATLNKTIPIENSYAMPLSYQHWRNNDFVKNDLINAHYDIITIKNLLTDGGFNDRDGDGWLDTINGDPIHLEILLPSGDSMTHSTAKIIVHNLQMVGIRASIRSVVQSTYTDTIKSNQYQATFINWNNGHVPFDFYIKFYSSPGDLSYKLSSGYANEKFDTALAEYLESPNDEAPKNLEAIMAVFSKDMPIIPLYSRILWHQFKTHRFKGWYKGTKGIRGSLSIKNRERLLQLLNLKPIT